MKKGTFITLEGIEGAGKSCHVPLIKEWVKTALKRDVVVTREPGGTEIGEQIRKVLSSTNNSGMCHNTELLLMFAARAEHLDKVIIPALAAGKVVLCDRFTDSSYAYQSGGRGMSLSRIVQLEKFTQGHLRPHCTLLFDVEAEIGLARAKGRGEVDRFEQEDVKFFQRVRQRYLNMANTQSRRYRIIDGSKNKAEVRRQIIATLQRVQW